MIQEILVFLIFAGATFYLGRLLYKQLHAKSACSTGCGKCGEITFNKAQAELIKKEIR